MIGLVVVLLGGATALCAADETPKVPEMPAPAKEHVWLQQLAGEWEMTGEATMDPTQPAMKCTGSEKARMLGGFWLVSEGRGEMPGMPGPMNSVLTLGYDPQKGKYIGSWIDSTSSYFWKSEGSVDASGKVLTLESEGPCPMKPGTAKFRDVVEIKSNDHHVLTSSMQGDDGKWQKMMTAHYRRKT